MELFLKSIFRRKNLDIIFAEAAANEKGLRRVLGPFDLILLGIGAVIGAGIFTTVGTAAVGDTIRPGAGPAIVLSFVITAIACGFAALCYAELSSMVPISGSAYTYAYATLGEFIAWIIGWDLIIEYAVGNIAVAISWSGYFSELMRGLGVMIPDWLTTDYRSAFSGETLYRAASMLVSGESMDAVTRMSASAAAQIQELVGRGMAFPEIARSFEHAHNAIANAPHVAGLPVIFNLPAVAIVAFVTTILVIGIRESARFNAVMVLIKLLILGFFVSVGFFYIKPENWVPFAPNGMAGIQAGAAIVFFAYIGFDAVSTAAEETKNPSRNLPIGIIGSLIICTVIYIVVALVFTGMVPLSVFTQSNKAEPLAIAMSYNALNWAAGIVAFGSVIANTAVIVVNQIGQTRLFYSMARDKLLPPSFAAVHSRFRTPHVTTIMTGVFVAFFAAFTSIDEMVDLINIGTLFAFILVCIGVLILRKTEAARPRGFRVPFAPLMCGLGIGACLYLIAGLPTITYMRFLVWLTVGGVLYFSYGYRKSRRRKTA
jgi:basic amino acid/polyamine antiporter, APA family